MSAGAIFGIVWAVGALLTFRPLARHLADDFGSSAEWERIVYAIGLGGGLAATVWPGVLAWFALRRSARAKDPARVAAALFGESRDRKLQRMRLEALERERRIQDLERELEIGR